MLHEVGRYAMIHTVDEIDELLGTSLRRLKARTKDTFSPSVYYARDSLRTIDKTQSYESCSASWGLLRGSHTGSLANLVARSTQFEPSTSPRNRNERNHEIRGAKLRIDLALSIRYGAF